MNSILIKFTLNCIWFQFTWFEIEYDIYVLNELYNTNDIDFEKLKWYNHKHIQTTESYRLAEILKGLNKSASKIVKESSKEKCDASIDIAVRLGVDPKQANQMVRGVATLPHGTGKSVSVLAIVTDDKKDEATKAGADYVGFEEYIEKIKKGWTDVDVIVTMPSAMSKLGALGKVLGPRGLMPNPKSGTVTNEIGKAIADIKKGKIDFKVDKNGIVHASIGKVSFDVE